MMVLDLAEVEVEEVLFLRKACHFQFCYADSEKSNQNDRLKFGC